MKSRIWFLLICGLGILGSGIAVSTPRAVAQGGDPCAAPMEAFWRLVTEACIGRPEGYICNGASAPRVLPQGPVAFALQNVGALVEVSAVDELQTLALAPQSNTGGAAYVRLLPPVQMTLLLLGDVTITDVTPPDFPTWQSLRVVTSQQAPTCPAAPQDALLVQVLQPSPTRIVINGISIDVAGTLMIRTTGDATVLTALSGAMRIFVLGVEEVFWAGEQVVVPFAPGDFSRPLNTPSDPLLLDGAALSNLPMMLLDRPVPLPQPGYVQTQGIVNLRAAPNTGAPLLAEVPAGVVLTVLGQSPDGAWLHVEGSNGLTGWMFAELLRLNVGTINAVYADTPTPPVRVGNPVISATVNAPAGINLRSAPDVSFPAIGSLNFGDQVNLLARSPYSPWVKIAAGAVVGWVALITLDTNAYIDSLPVDYDVPPPPGPTRVPGSWGNAFPDPRRGG